jgi:hypothetical protein
LSHRHTAPARVSLPLFEQPKRKNEELVPSLSQGSPMTSRLAHCLLLPSSFRCQYGRGGLRFLCGSLTHRLALLLAVGKRPYDETAFRTLMGFLFSILP